MKIEINNTGFRQEELEAAERLSRELETFFNRQYCEGEIHIMNFQLPPGYTERDIDVLVLIKIKEGYSVKFNSNGTAIELEGEFIFNIETKSHSQFQLYGEEIEVKYADGVKKNATKQAWNVKNNFLNYLRRNFNSNVPWIYDIVFLPMCSRETTLAIFGCEEKIPINLLDSSITAEKIFEATVQNGRTFMNPSNGGIEAIKKFLCEAKSLPKYFSNRLDLLAINSLKNQQKLLFENADDYYILRGSPGAGKTILMLGKCLDLISNGQKCLYLTYNRQLVLDLQRLQEAIKSIAPFNPLLSLRFETWESFVTRLYSFYSYFRPLGASPASFEEKVSDLKKRYKERFGKELLANDEEKNNKNIFKYSAVDYVFVDEAQDLPSNVFSILENLFAKNICLAVGEQQEYTIVNHRKTCNELLLEKIHRQRELLSQIVRKFLEYTRLAHTYQMQSPVPTQLVAGDSIVYTGVINDDCYNHVFEYLKNQGSSKIDFLHLHINQGDVTANTSISHYFGGNVEGEVNVKLDRFRYFHYNSCRGLEGCVVLYEKIDSYYDWCVNKFGEEDAKKRLFIALTRVKDVAIFTFSDLNHWLYTDVVSNFSVIKRTLFLR